MSQGAVLELKLSSKWGPNRIFDAEGVRKPLDRHLGGYHSALRANLALLDHSWSALGACQEGRAEARRAQGELSEDQAAARGGVGEGINPAPQGLEEKRD